MGKNNKPIKIALLTIIASSTIGCFVWLTKNSTNPHRNNSEITTQGGGIDNSPSEHPSSNTPTKSSSSDRSELKESSEGIQKFENLDTAIAELREHFSGLDLGYKLEELGRSYGSADFDTIKNFILTAPPGTVGEMALTGLMKGLDPSLAPQVFEFIQGTKNHLGDSQTSAATYDLFSHWGRKDFASAWSYALEVGSEHPQHFRWLATSLWGASNAEGLNAIQSLEKETLRLVASEDGGMNAFMRAGEFPALFEALDGQLNSSKVQISFERRIKSFENRPEILRQLYNSPVEGKNDLLSVTINDWIRTDPIEGLEFLSSLNDSDVSSQVITNSYQIIADADPATAREWALLIKNPKLRKKALKEIDKS